MDSVGPSIAWVVILGLPVIGGARRLIEWYQKQGR